MILWKSLDPTKGCQRELEEGRGGFLTGRKHRGPLWNLGGPFSRFPSDTGAAAEVGKWLLEHQVKDTGSPEPGQASLPLPQLHTGIYPCHSEQEPGQVDS